MHVWRENELHCNEYKLDIKLAALYDEYKAAIMHLLREDELHRINMKLHCSV